jgi:hypothetical protein
VFDTNCVEHSGDKHPKEKNNQNEADFFAAREDMDIDRRKSITNQQKYEAHDGRNASLPDTL